MKLNTFLLISAMACAKEDNHHNGLRRQLQRGGDGGGRGGGDRRPGGGGDGDRGDGDDGGNRFCGTAPADVSQDDMGVRFNKVFFPENLTPPDAVDVLPLAPTSFPICGDTTDLLRQSKCHSVIDTSDCFECDIPLSDLIQTVGGLPTHPHKNPSEDDAYWAELREVILARQDRLNNVDPVEVLGRIPAVWTGFSLEDIAEAVHNEYPGKNQADLIAQFISDGVQMDDNIIPRNTLIEFLRYQVLLAEINTWAVSMVGPHNFALKYAGGRARPEEIVWHIKNSDANEVASWNIPSDIVQNITDMTLENAYAFTAYDEGSPPHPSWPAMHSAASVASFWLAIVMDLDQEQLCEAMALDFGVAYGRTIAGVHFPTDNTAGLNLGQELLARKLPGYLAERYGSDPDAVRAKILQYRFNWETDYFTGPCFD